MPNKQYFLKIQIGFNCKIKEVVLVTTGTELKSEETKTNIEFNG